MITEPLLALDDIQGLVLPGFLKPHLALISLYLTASARPRITAQLLRMLEEGRISPGAKTLEDRQLFRSGHPGDGLLRGVALTAPGLDRLRHGLPDTMPGVAFQAGMPARAGLLGDPPPASWQFGGAAVPHLLLVVAGNEHCPVRLDAEALVHALTEGDSDLLAAPVQYGNVLGGDLRGREHFGFADGVSQPGIRGRTRAAPDAFLTARRLPANDPEQDLFGLPGQHLVWPGEFVLGYPASSPDPRLPGAPRPVPSWMHNGAFLVYRRLRQHVEAFHRVIAAEAERLRRLPGFEGLTAERLAAQVVGRWPSGAPLSRAPLQDNPALGAEAMLNNDFRFDADTPQRQLDRTGFAPALQGATPDPALADPLGQVCPVGAHIRKVNPRDQASDVGGASAAQTRRILRVGLPYEDSLPAKGNQPASTDRGLLFLSVQASIEDQFEFLQARWMNSRSRPRGLGGNDMLVGQQLADAEGVHRRCLLFGAGLAQAEVRAQEDFVTMTGGGYFFVPAIGVLRQLLRGDPLTPLQPG